MTEKEDISNKENVKVDENKSGDGKDKKPRNSREKNKPLTKIVIRHLPPTMSEETFLKQIDPLPDNDYFYYVPADWSLGPNATCRAYINFVNQDDIFIFRDKFDGYIFVDQKGIDFQAIVEFAPFQGLPKSRARKKDNKCNSIETDQHYISFVEALNNEQNDTGKGETKLEFSYQFSTSKDDIKKITKTPLLEFLANKKQEKKRRNEEQKKQRREEERQKRKDKVIKAIPSAIKEEEPFNSRDILVNTGGIMVRKVKSRLDRGKSGSNNEGSSRRENSGRKEKTYEAKETVPSAPTAKYSDRNNDRDDNRRSYKDYKEDRKRRDEKRREQRKAEYKRKEAEKELDEKFKVTNTNQTTEEEPSQSNSAPLENVAPRESTPPIKKEIKKYSEVRKERRARASASQAEKIPNDTANKTTNAGYSGQNSYNDDIDETDGYIPKRSEYNPKETIAQRLQRESDDRAARRIRNKNRPSLEIYRPGKLRTGPNKKLSDDEKGDKDSPDSGCDRNCSSSRRNSSKSVDDEDLTPKSDEIPTLIVEKKEKKLYEMSPDIPPFIPKSMQVQIEQNVQNDDVDIGPGQ